MESRLCIGTDEAGYGPNLGPLIIVGTAWELEADLHCRDLRRQLQDVVTDRTAERHRRLLVADSKTVYSAGDSLESLELAVLAFLRAIRSTPASLTDLGVLLAGSQFAGEFAAEPWNAPAETPALPRDCLAEVIAEWSDLLLQAMHGSGVRFRGMAAEIIFPERFNKLVDQHGSKGALLSEATMRLVRRLSDQFPAGRYEVVCDRHGGRSRYDELIAAAFDDQFVFRVEETSHSSRYRMSNMEFCFRTKAEELLPVALASMTAKYLRELLMDHFNDWWAEQVPGLKPTRGYPVDARRFREDVEQQRTALGIPEHVFWRQR